MKKYILILSVAIYALALTSCSLDGGDSNPVDEVQDLSSDPTTSLQDDKIKDDQQDDQQDTQYLELNPDSQAAELDSIPGSKKTIKKLVLKTNKKSLRPRINKPKAVKKPSKKNNKSLKAEIRYECSDGEYILHEIKDSNQDQLLKCSISRWSGWSGLLGGFFNWFETKIMVKTGKDSLDCRQAFGYIFIEKNCKFPASVQQNADKITTNAVKKQKKINKKHTKK